MADGGLNLLDGDVKALRDERKIGVEVFDLFAEKVAGDGGVVVDEEAAFAVEEPAARGEDGNLADAVGLGERTEAFGVEHLEAPEAGQENGENQRDEILDRVKLADGQLLGLAGGAEVLGFGMVRWFHAGFSVYDWLCRLALPLLCIKVVR